MLCPLVRRGAGCVPCVAQQRQAKLQGAITTAAAELAQMQQEARDMEDKARQLAAQLSSSSHVGSTEDVANLMMVLANMQERAARLRRGLADRELQAATRRDELAAVTAQVAEAALKADGLMQQCDTGKLVGRKFLGWPDAIRTCDMLLRGGRLPFG